MRWVRKFFRRRLGRLKLFMGEEGKREMEDNGKKGKGGVEGHGERGRKRRVWRWEMVGQGV